jgi:hypothetical protein
MSITQIECINLAVKAAATMVAGARYELGDKV